MWRFCSPRFASRRSARISGVFGMNKAFPLGNPLAPLERGSPRESSPKKGLSNPLARGAPRRAHNAFLPRKKVKSAIITHRLTRNVL